LDRKGIRDAVTVLTAVAKTFPSVSVTIAGCGMPAETVLADFPVEIRSAIRVVPSIASETALIAEYRKHSIYFLPSVFEGQPLTMMEAAAAGLALVSTATCGMKDFIRDGENGLLADVGDAAALESAVVRLVRDPGFAARLGRQAQLDSRKYTWRHAADGVLQAVSSAARSHRVSYKGPRPFVERKLQTPTHGGPVSGRAR
jgi:glycosyltransferase involved in cell wall biosynthesis